jgi:hypothetical protein
MVLEPFQQRLLTDYFEGVRETLILIPEEEREGPRVGYADPDA